MGGTRAGMADLGLLVLRVGVGSFMAFHGWGKIQGFTEMSTQFMDFMGLGMKNSLCLCIFAEFFCSLGLVVGLATRLACIPLIVTMSVAGFMIHAADPWKVKELAFLYLTIYVALLLVGPGRYSLDHKLFGKKDLPDLDGGKSPADPTSTVIRGGK